MTRFISQIFIKQLVRNLRSKGTYFKLVTNVPSTVSNDKNLLSMKFFSCGINDECLNIVQSQFGRIEEKGTVWKKAKEPGKTMTTPWPLTWNMQLNLQLPLSDT